MKKIQQLWSEKPLEISILIALLIRLVAAVLSRGYGMHDDHFIIIEDAQRWVDQILSGTISQLNEGPKGHSFFYPGLHVMLFFFCQKAGILDPQQKMLIVRLIHALFSLLVITASYRITQFFAGKRTAGQVAFLLAMLWFLPFFSVRNLVEVFSIPWLVLAVWMIIKAGNHIKPGPNFLAAGIMLGIAFSVRYQTFIFASGVFLVMLLHRQWKGILLALVSYFTVILLFQGLVDYLVWGRPFAEFSEYVKYNFLHATSYIVTPWYTYLVLLLGMLIPPISFFLFFGFFRNWRKQLILFLPAFLFLVFHSIFPNKQERFIFPILPFFIMLGLIGWNEFINVSSFWKTHPKLLRSCWIFFWIINLLLLIPVSTAYSKRSRVETMTYLSGYKDIKTVLIDFSPEENPYLLPQFYLGKPIGTVKVIECSVMKETTAWSESPEKYTPDVVLLSGTKDLQARVLKLKAMIPGMKYETVISPGLIDQVLFTLNPLNRNQVITVYSTHEMTKLPLQ